MRIIFFLIFVSIIQFPLIAQENNTQPVKEAEVKSDESKTGEPVKEVVREPETKKADEKPAEETSSFSGNKNSWEFKPGVFHSKDENHPMMGFMYQRSLTENWNIGISLQSAILTSDVKAGNILSDSRAHASLNPIDFVTSYHFRAGSSFRPFLRGYIGPAILHMNAGGRGRNETLFHAGLGGGFRYYFTESFFGVMELNANYFAYKEMHNKNPGNDIFAQFGLGFTH